MMEGLRDDNGREGMDPVSGRFGAPNACERVVGDLVLDSAVASLEKVPAVPLPLDV